MKIPLFVKCVIPLVLGLISCSKKDSSKPKPGPIDVVVVPPPGGGIDLTDRNTRLKFAFEGLAQTCEVVGGTFDSRTRNCVCPEAGIPTSFQAINKIINEGGVKKRVFDHYECKEQLALKPVTEGISSFTALLQTNRKSLTDDLARSRGLGNGRVVAFRIPKEIPDQSLADLATFLDTHDVRIGIPNGNQRVEGFYVSLNSKGFIGRTERVGFFDFEDIALAERPGNEIFAWVPEDLLKLQYKPSAETIELVTVEGPNADFLAGLRFFQSNLKGDIKGDIQEDVTIIDKGCEVVCDYSATFTFNGRFYWYEKNYARGQHFRHALYMGHEDGRIDAMAVLFNDYSPSVIITEKATVGSGGEISVSNEALDPRLQSVDHESYPVIGKAYYEKLGHLDRLDTQNPQVSALYIEGRTQLEESWEESFWLRGPYAADFPSPTGSAMGWMNGDSADLNLVTYFTGVFDAGFYTSAKHVREVLHDIVKDFRRGEAYAIPADLMLAGTQLKQLAALSKSRIATVSSVFPIGEAECNRILGTDDGGLIWVVGAGNEGVENPKFRCPQRLHRDGLKIVVASGSKTTLSEQAEHGVDYADIAADPTSYLGRHGSSYAAPKVANVALKIIKKFGNSLSNREVRLAIFLGADVNVSSRLKVRTGGALNEAFALKAAEAIQGLSWQERKSLVDPKTDRRSLFAELIAQSGASRETDAKNQAEYLQGAKL